LCAATPALAQIFRDARYDILRTVMADQAAARLNLPFGTEGVELTDSGQINNDKLQKEIQKNGASVQSGKVVTVTDIVFDDNKIILELDGGGKNKKSILDRIQIGMGGPDYGPDGAPAPDGGGPTVPIRGDKTAQAKGSKVVLKFAKKVPSDLKPDQLRQLLDPVLDFNKHNFMKTGIEALPPEFQEAVKSKEAKIGMDRSTVLMALGRPDQKFRDPSKPNYEQWLYHLRGLRALFVDFEENIVVRVRQFQ
ncbi:MAG TPA: hypothetical protein VKY31_03245, partial [Terriglobia bacterium]|nr:hypothetical protein [Terriglobia bacterium]